MMMTWWFLWMMFVFVFLVPSVGYGWGYRRWGPPYPRYIQRRRARQTGIVGGPASFNHEAWGGLGDFVWMMLLIAIFWAAIAFFWR